MNTAASSGSSSPSSISILRRQRVDHRVPVRVAGAMPSDERRRAGDLALADVEQHEHRLLGEEPEAADAPSPRRRRAARLADRRPASSAGLSRSRIDLLALVRLALGRRAVAAASPEPLEAALDHREVGQDELEVELLEVAGRVDGARRVRLRRRSPRSAQTTWSSASESRSRARCSAGSSSVPTRPSVDARRRRQVHVGHVGLDDLLGLEDLGQPVEPLVGDLDHAELSWIPPNPPVSAWPRVSVLKTVVLPRPGKADDGDLHAADATGHAATGAQYPASGPRR